MADKCIPINIKTANALYNFTTWLTKKMDECDISDAELAQYVGVERKTILDIRLGKRFPKLDILVMIFDFFDKSSVIVPFSREIPDDNK